MSFQIKDFSSISASIINYAKAIQSRITDFSVGSIARTMLEAPAVEIEELYQQMFLGLKEAIPVAIYNTFEFDRLPAQSASGLIRVTITPAATDTFIAAGAQFSSAEYSVVFTSLADALIPAGNSYVDIQVSAKTPGAFGNVVANTVFTVLPAVQGLVSALALSSFTNGRDTETDAQRKSRFAAFILTLNHGTVSALRYGLQLVNVVDNNGNIIESVRHTSIVEPYLDNPLEPVGLVNCYIHNGTSGASSELLNQAEKIIHGYTDSDGAIISGWKAAGVKVTITAASSVDIDVTATVSVDSYHDVAATKLLIQSAISDYISALDIGDDVLIAELVSAAMDVPGVINFVLSAPASDTAISSTQKAVPGVFTL